MKAYCAQLWSFSESSPSAFAELVTLIAERASLAEVTFFLGGGASSRASDTVSVPDTFYRLNACGKGSAPLRIEMLVSPASAWWPRREEVDNGQRAAVAADDGPSLREAQRRNAIVWNELESYPTLLRIEWRGELRLLFESIDEAISVLDLGDEWLGCVDRLRRMPLQLTILETVAPWIKGIEQLSSAFVTDHDYLLAGRDSAIGKRLQRMRGSFVAGESFFASTSVGGIPEDLLFDRDPLFEPRTPDEYLGEYSDGSTGTVFSTRRFEELRSIGVTRVIESVPAKF